MQLVPKRQIGGNLYKIDNTMPQITQRYVALLNKGIPAQAAFDTAHLSLIEDGRPNKFYSFGKRATNLQDWTNNASDSLTVGRYKNLQNVQNFNQFKQKLKQKRYNNRPAFYNTEINRGRSKDKQIINQWNKEQGLNPIAQINNIAKKFIVTSFFIILVFIFKYLPYIYKLIVVQETSIKLVSHFNDVLFQNIFCSRPSCRIQMAASCYAILLTKVFCKY